MAVSVSPHIPYQRFVPSSLTPNSWTKPLNGEGGIRTLDTGLTPYNGLANRRLQPLGHLSRSARTGIPRVTIWSTRANAQSNRQRDGRATGYDCLRPRVLL